MKSECDHFKINADYGLTVDSIQTTTYDFFFFFKANLLYLISGGADYLLLLLEEDSRGSQLPGSPQTPPPARLPPHQDADCFDSGQHPLSTPLQRVLYVWLSRALETGTRSSCFQSSNRFPPLFQWTSAQPARMTLTARTASRS